MKQYIPVEYITALAGYYIIMKTLGPHTFTCASVPHAHQHALHHSSMSSLRTSMSRILHTKKGTPTRQGSSHLKGQAA